MRNSFGCLKHNRLVSNPCSSGVQSHGCVPGWCGLAKRSSPSGSRMRIRTPKAFPTDVKSLARTILENSIPDYGIEGPASPSKAAHTIHEQYEPPR